MNKKRAHYDLKVFKAAFASVGELSMTGSAFDGMEAVGLVEQDVVAVIQSLTSRHLKKSMTSDLNSKIWQDVYNVQHRGIALYVKLTVDGNGEPLIISFKEK